MTALDETTHGPQHRWTDGVKTYVWDPEQAALTTYDGGDPTTMHLHVHDLSDARDRIALIRRGRPEHVHTWRPDAIGLVCACRSRSRFGQILYPEVLA